MTAGKLHCTPGDARAQYDRPQGERYESRQATHLQSASVTTMQRSTRTCPDESAETSKSHDSGGADTCPKTKSSDDEHGASGFDTAKTIFEIGACTRHRFAQSSSLTDKTEYRESVACTGYFGLPKVVSVDRDKSRPC